MTKVLVANGAHYHGFKLASFALSNRYKYRNSTENIIHMMKKDKINAAIFLSDCTIGTLITQTF